MGKVHDIAVVAVLNDILSYDVSLMFTKVDDVFHVTLTWLGELPDGTTGMGTARGSDEKLYHALSDAYKDMIKPAKKDKEK